MRKRKTVNVLKELGQKCQNNFIVLEIFKICRTCLFCISVTSHLFNSRTKIFVWGTLVKLWERNAKYGKCLNI